MEKPDILIVGTGIAGSLTAYELQKRRINYEIITEEKNPCKNVSSLSFGHFRVAQRDELEQLVERCVCELGENEQRMRLVYSNSHLAPELLRELGIPFQKRSFGVIPTKNKRGGAQILSRVQEHINISNETELVDFERKTDSFGITLKKEGVLTKRESSYIVLATGGYSGIITPKNKCMRIFDLVKANGGRIINLDCVFSHPFGFNGGKNLLTGEAASKGFFIDEHGRAVFDKKTEELLKQDNYHEIFPEITEQIRKKEEQGHDIYFKREDASVRITPYVHYTAGGIETDLSGEVEGCKGLFAIGECQANGSKNNGRLPGYPFTSAVVYSKILAEYFSKI